MLMRSAWDEPGPAACRRELDAGRARAIADPDRIRRPQAELQAIVASLGGPPPPRWSLREDATTHPASLVGRAPELAELVDNVRAGTPAAVVGEAGIGKTALVRAAAEAAGRTLRVGGGFATLSWLPYLALRRATGLTDTGDPESIAGVVARAVGPHTLFIDDLQWADEATRAVVSLLLGRIAIVVAVREGDARSADTLASLAGHDVATIRLGGLDDAAAKTLARRIRPALSDAGLTRIAGLAGGNPLLVEELASHGQPSTSLARAIVAQLDTLPQVEREALDLLALAGRPVAAELTGPVARALIGRGIVQGPEGAIEIRHGLIAEAILEGLDDDRRRSIHRRLGELLAEPAERARHLAAAGLRAAAFDTAVAALAEGPDPHTRATLLTIAAETSDDEAAPYRVRAAIAHAGVGNEAEAAAMLAAPIGGDDEAQTLGAAARAALLNDQGRTVEAWAAVEGARGLRSAPASPGAIALVAAESVVLANRGRLADAIALVERCLTTGPAAALSDRLAGHLAALRLHAGETDELGELETAVRVAETARDGGTAAARAFDLLAMTLMLRGAAAAVEVAVECAGRLDELDYRTRATELRAEGTLASIFAGDLATAVARADGLRDLPIGRAARERLACSRGLGNALLGNVDAAERTFVELLSPGSADFVDRGTVLWSWGEACLWAGQPARAHEMAAAALELPDMRGSDLVLGALTRGWADVELGRQPAAYEADLRFRFHAGAAPELRGIAALGRGELRSAAEAFDEAAGRWAGFNAIRALVCRWAAGDALQQAGDRQIGIDWLRAAERGADAIGFEPMAARARRSLRRAGERPDRSAPAGRTGGLLTRREREVLELVERGLTNADIARRVSLGRPTVARLLSNAMLKLGAESRAQAVVLAARFLTGPEESGAIAR